MSEWLGNAVVLAALGLSLALAARSVWKNRGSRCDGDCSHCRNCKK